MNPARIEMACAVCLTPLNILDGEYLHPAYRDDDGHQPVPVPTASLDTVHRACDFCGDLKPLWVYTGGEQVLQILSSKTETLQGLSETWSACAACSLDIETGRYQEPANRAARRLGRFDQLMWVTATAMHAPFFAGLQPGRTLTTTTAWPDLNLAARDLPRVRDGLTRFLRGDLRLPATTSIPNHRNDLASCLNRVRMYWIDDIFTDMAEVSSTQLPAVSVTRDLAPCDDGLLVWSRPVAGRGITAATWTCQDDAVWIVLYRAIGGGLDELPLQTVRNEVGWLAPIRDHRVRYGETIEHSASHPAATVLATWLLLAQGVAETSAAPVDRAVRKKYERMKRVVPDVRIVHLRAQHRGSGSIPQPTAGRTYTKRVWVTGHWRNQPYGPGRSLRRPVYIHPHLRGPEDAEINLSTTVRVLGRRTENDRAPGTRDH
jgi:hypothetical protein